MNLEDIPHVEVLEQHTHGVVVNGYMPWHKANAILYQEDIDSVVIRMEEVGKPKTEIHFSGPMGMSNLVKVMDGWYR